ncbi:unnamed protein product [Ceutorhynchus assimilis]|uniref:Uncharacterized protein n=1 Tax=Ceutorhynchus assimilis TaxID=467358 RepID=A0A9P0DID8_9CUCU|nr:unnamed protein product [Ceutorhynchus assimilis]
MVMDQFVTTYRKDYLWPYVRTLGVRPYNEPKDRLTPCECRGLSDSKRYADPVAQMLGPHAYEGESWSRLGPMGPLLDPKVYPAKMSAAPESQLSRYDQPNVFLAKLQEKYPFIYECLRTAPPDDILARINRDRLRTTYQVDYCKMKEIPHGSPMEMIRAATNDVAPSCPPKMLTCGHPCKPVPRNKALRVSTITKHFLETSMAARGYRTSCQKEPKDSISFREPAKPSTTYQDTIGKSGNLILIVKL